MVELLTRAATLIAIARGAIVREAGPPASHAWDDPWLREAGASFVTLRLDGDLRGCVGSVDAHRPLGDDVAHNAFAAAYRDSRFEPVSLDERARLAVEVSVLTPRTPVQASSEDEALACEFADFLATDPSLSDIADWLYERGLDVGVSMPPTEQK